MAKLNFIKGTIRGKIGEFVGSSWKGKSYIKTFTKPGNPRTADQVAVRSVFYRISRIAKAIYADILKPFTFPRPQRQTAYNRMIQINKAMFENKEFNPAALNIFEGPLLNPGILTASLTDGKTDITFPQEGDGSDVAFGIVYDSESGAVFAGISNRGNGSVEVNTPGATAGSLHAYLVFVRGAVIGTDEKGQNSNTAYKKIE